MSAEKKDPLIRDLAVQNVLVVDAFLRRFVFYPHTIFNILTVCICQSLVPFPPETLKSRIGGIPHW